MGFANAGGLSGLLGELVNHVAQQQGVTPQEVLAQHGVTEADVHPDNVSQENILGHLMQIAGENPQLVQGLMAVLPGLTGNSQLQGAGSVLGDLLGGLAGAAQQQQGGNTLSGLLGGLIGDGSTTPDPNASPAPAISPQVAQLINGLLASMNKQ